MAMRDLITGATSCPDPAASSSSSANPLGALANALIGSSSSKTQERLNEIPSSTPTGPASQLYSHPPPTELLPGSEFDKPFFDPHSQGSEFLHRFRSATGGGGLEETWDEIQREGRVGQIPPSQVDGAFYDGAAAPSHLLQPALDEYY